MQRLPRVRWIVEGLLCAGLATACGTEVEGSNFAPGATGGSPNVGGRGGGSTGGSPSTGGSGGVTGTGGAPTPEDCLDGSDNDRDFLADCADSECMDTHACVPPPPPGWQGPGWLATLATSCNGDFSEEQPLFERDQLEVPDAACACTCAPGVAATCVAEVKCYEGTTCSDPALRTEVTVGASCTPIQLPPGACLTQSPQAVNLGCTPQAERGSDEWQWPGPSRTVCLTPRVGTCGNPSEVCAPIPPPGAGPLCITSLGDVSCPAHYTERFLYHDGTVDDQRGCESSGCSCDGSYGTCTCAGGACNVSYHAGSACSSSQLLAQGVASGQCQLVNTQTVPTGGSVQVSGLQAPSVTCVPSGTPTANGTAEPAGPITVCCAP